VLVAAAFSWRWKVHVAEEAVDAMEIDLSRPFRITDNPALAHRAKNPGLGAPVVEKVTPVAGKGVAGGEETLPAKGKGPVKEWTLPVPGAHQVLENPADAAPAGQKEGPGEGAGLGGLGGTGEGEVDWVYLTDLPKLLNREQVLRDMLRFYPEEERAAGREGQVLLDVHISPEGRVVAVEVAQSDGPLFDAAARKVLSRARFSPAKVKDKKVPVKMRQPLSFQLPQ
jgi:TonB family protein